MSVQKQLGVFRAKELEKTNHEIGMLGNFTDLVGAFIGSHMLKICRFEKEHFLQDFSDCLRDKRDPLFEAELGFDKSNQLCMLPKTDVFIEEVMNSVMKIENDMTEASKTLDFEGALRDVEKYGFKMNQSLKLEGNNRNSKCFL